MHSQLALTQLADDTDTPAVGGKLEGTIHHHEKLLAAFGGSATGWSYTGEVADCGNASMVKCPCGHPIRYKFLWQHDDGRTMHTGSVCVNTLPGLDQAVLERMRGDLEALRAKAREDAKKAKAARQTQEVQELLALVNHLPAENSGRRMMAASPVLS